MALPKVRTALTAAAAGAATIMVPAAANAQDAEMQPVASSSISAPIEASRWSSANNGGVAIAVSMGTDRPVTREQIESILRQDFRENGVTKVVFFYDQIDAPGVGFMLCVDGESSGVLTLANVREAVPERAKEARFMGRNPQLAQN